MIPDTPLRRLAAVLLRAAIRFAPCDAREWGHAALAELGHVEGNWAAVAWALGGAGVLAKQTLLALMMPWRSRQAVPAGNPLSREVKMHKASLIAGGACRAGVPAGISGVAVAVASGDLRSSGPVDTAVER